MRCLCVIALYALMTGRQEVAIAIAGSILALAKPTGGPRSPPSRQGC
ncbi:MAG: hypothetical protein LUD74_07275 [Tannerellaceae bacterium]|nr:hypothetical protein [Tannerellaceae bacterium]